jgi:hypothetical protein
MAETLYRAGFLKGGSQRGRTGCFTGKDMRKLILSAALPFIIFTLFPISNIHAGISNLVVIHGSHLNGYVLPCPT